MAMLKIDKVKSARINLEFREDKLDEIERLQAIGGLSTRKELFENALTLIKWSMRAKQAGKSVGFLGENDTFQEIIMPVLENARESKDFI